MTCFSCNKKNACVFEVVTLLFRTLASLAYTVLWSIFHQYHTVCMWRASGLKLNSNADYAISPRGLAVELAKNLGKTLSL